MQHNRREPDWETNSSSRRIGHGGAAWAAPMGGVALAVIALVIVLYLAGLM